MRDEKNVPAEQQEAKEDSRVPRADEVARRPARSSASSSEGPEASRRLDLLAGETLPRELRLRKRQEFKTVYSSGQRIPARHFVFFLLKNDLGWPRLGVTVTRRYGSAVHRNRAKRAVREAFRRRKRQFDSWDLVVNVRPGRRPLFSEEAGRDFDELLRRVARFDPSPAERRP